MRIMGMLSLSLLALVSRAESPPQASLPSVAQSAEVKSAPEEKAALCLADLEALGKKHNPTLVQAQSQIEGTLGKALQAGLYPNPTIGYVGEQIGVRGTAGELHGGFVQQEIVTAKKLQLSRQKYLARADVAELQALAQHHRVMNDIRIHFFMFLGAGEQLRSQLELLKSAEDNLVTVKEMVNVGQANQAELRQAQVDLQRQRLSVRMAQNVYRKEWVALTAVVGVDLKGAPVQGSLEIKKPLIDFDGALGYLLAESPQIKAAHAKLRADRITVQRERAEPIPNIVVSGTAGRNFEARETVYGASVSIKLPLFDRNQGTIRQAQADLARQHAEVRRLELWLRRALAVEYQKYLTAFQHVQDYKTIILPRARDAYRLQLKSYEARRATWPEVLLYQRRYFDLRSKYIQNLVALRASEVQINGLLLTNGLNAPSGITPPGHIDAVPKPR